MKIPYIINYLEEYDLKPDPVLHYDNKKQINYLDNLKREKALSFGPQTTRMTETTENDDKDEYYFGPDTTRETATIENRDVDDYFVGPDTTVLTFTNENQDRDEIIYVGPDTTTITETTENSDSDEIIIM